MKQRNLKAVLLGTAVLCLGLLLVAYSRANLVVAATESEQLQLPGDFAASTFKPSSAKNNKAQQNVTPQGLQSEEKRREHQKNASNHVTNSNLRQHVSFKILRPVNWDFSNTIYSNYGIIPDPGANVSPSAGEIYFSVRTTQANHATRLPVLILTWMQTVLSNQVYIITDRVNAAGEKWVDIAKNHVVPVSCVCEQTAGFHVKSTDCPPGHKLSKLCCKSGHEFQSYYTAQKSGHQYKWFCHFDDDVYVNVPMLTAALSMYDPLRDNIYIGRTPERGKKRLFVPRRSQAFFHYMKYDYSFTYGAGYCISDVLMRALEQYLKELEFSNNCVKLGMPDDMLLGVVIEAVLGYSTTHNSAFNSHYNLQPYSALELKRQVTVSYSVSGTHNLIILPNATFTKEKDPTRLFSYHCFLQSQTKWCKTS